MNSGIYQILNRKNGKRYIGSSTRLDNRISCHLKALKENWHHSVKLQRAYNKYGKENFEIAILKYCDPSELIKHEQYYLDFYNASKDGYNISPTAKNCLGVKHSKESRKNMSNAHKGRPWSKQQRINITKALHAKGAWNKGLKGFMKGRKVTDETKRKISLANKGNQYFLGKKHTKQAKEKIGSANRGSNNGMAHCIGDLNTNARLTWPQVRELRALRKQGHSYIFLAKHYDIAVSTVALIIKNRTWVIQ